MASYSVSKTALFRIREAHLEDMPFLLTLAGQEGWYPGLEDGAAFYAIDPHGFFIGELDQEPIGCISGVNYDSQFGFLGLYIVKEPYRHQGFGIQLWQRAMEHLGKRTIGLDGVMAQQANYQKSGFKLYYHNIRFQTVGTLQTLSKRLIKLSGIPFQTILDYDTSIFGFSRQRFLQEWLHTPSAYCLGVCEGSRLLGYGVIRPCIKDHFKIGPLFADNSDIAFEIYQGLVSSAASHPIFLDVPEVNPHALALAQHQGMTKVYETARMYNQTPPNQQLDKVYGVTTFEMG